MANKTNLSIGAAIAVLVAAYFGIDLKQDQQNPSATSAENAHLEAQNLQKPQQQAVNHQNSSQINATQSSQNRHGLAVIQKSFERKLSNVQVQSEGKVKAVLRDDHEGSRHQKFILTLDNGLTLLVAHNIDLAPRLENLKKGDLVEFFGEYEYSPQGGVMHWTHHDPQGRHEDGWLKHNGQISR